MIQATQKSEVSAHPKGRVGARRGGNGAWEGVGTPDSRRGEGGVGNSCVAGAIEYSMLV